KLKKLNTRKNEIINQQKVVPPLPDIDPENIQMIQDNTTPRPGSEAPELSSDVPPLPDIDPENIQMIPDNTTPRPGSEIPELSSDVPPLPDIDPENIQMIPDNTTLLDKINELEKEIIKELNSLKSLCDDEGEDIISNSCDAACKKYSECTHYTEDTTAQDRKDAYDSCMIECAKWSDKTKICINKKPIKTVMDCANLSICALSEYSNAVEGIKK
ncbi:MAG TPA: hypothetical protein PKC87_03945, partial [Candidatus Absconditabacterales bacterium]|nr:hypothetical protein [Candidatus Absconditabacterales bacterium]